MIRKLLTCTFLGFLLLGLSGCHDKKAPLDKEKFTALLIDMHRVDGTLAVDRNKRGGDELKNSRNMALRRQILILVCIIIPHRLPCLQRYMM